ncbi:MAG: AI-2E family transporter [Bacteroidota bacterium]|nr:AI-2E family transporter [Bacteroidota bacterium]
MKIPPYAKYVIILIGFVTIFFILFIGKTIIIPIFIALLFSLLMLPFSNWLEKKGISRGLSAIISILSIMLLLSGLGFFLFTQIKGIAQDADRIQSEVQSFQKEAQYYIEDRIGIKKQEQADYIEKVQENSNGSIAQTIMKMASSLFIASILLPMSMYFMMAYRSHYKEFLFQLYDEDKHSDIQRIFKSQKSIIVKYITGIFTVVVILSVCNIIALMLFDLEHAVLFGVMAALLNIIPLIGTVVGSLLPVLFALIMKDTIWFPIGIALYFWGIQIIESSIITPNVVGNSVRTNPYAIILAVFIGGEVWGAAGMVLFIPMLALVKVFCRLIEPLHPYGFLLTDPDVHKDGFLTKGFNKIKGMFTKG